MLDPASIERLAEFPERNDPLLNVALAEEGGGDVLLALARCSQLGAEALDIIAARVEREGDALTAGQDEAKASVVFALERELIAHPHAPRSVRDAVLARHTHDAFFVLSAAAHPDATAFALKGGASWPSPSPLHDRPWLALLEGAARSPALLRGWATGNELLREAAGLLSPDGDLLEQLASDPSRRVRRAVASNAHAGELRGRMAKSDAAVEVRTRAGSTLATDDRREPSGRFSSFLVGMEQGGVLSADVRQALVGAGPSLDEQGAFLGAKYLDQGELRTLVSQASALDEEPLSPRGVGVGAGLGLRCAPVSSSGNEHGTPLTNDIVHLVTRHPSTETRLTGKARVALWIAESLNRSRVVDIEELTRWLVAGALASDRMVLLRWAGRRGASLAGVTSLDAAASVPLAVVELCWRDPKISDETAVLLAARAALAARSERELPEDELDLAPLARPLLVLEQAVLSAISRTPVSPRAALAAIALEPRRCRYVLSAMPTWKGALTGARLARVLRAHAGALSAARPSAGAAAAGGARPASVARWTHRRLAEMEAAIAIAVGDLTATELVRRLGAGSIRLEDGVALAAGVEARAAVEGPATMEPVLEYATSRRTNDAAALALWMLLEGLDRVRAPSLVASAIDGLSVSGSVVAPAVCEALATLERRAPGRLDHVHAQSPRGRATVASAIARAYRAFGGMRDEA
jgi:hypothetical protein